MDESIFREVIAHATAWLPKYRVVDSVWHAADLINQPHEDYPLRVPVTAQAITTLIKHGKDVVVDEKMILTIHSFIGRDNPRGILRGAWRQCDVRVGSYIAPRHEYVPELMARISPAVVGDDLDMWYRRFESVHPFEDWNGRVGGIVIAALWYLEKGDGTYLSPTQ